MWRIRLLVSTWFLTACQRQNNNKTRKEKRKRKKKKKKRRKKKSKKEKAKEEKEEEDEVLRSVTVWVELADTCCYLDNNIVKSV